MKPKHTPKTNFGEDTNTTIAKILVVFYLLTGFVPLMGAIDYDAPEWLYLSIVNMVSLIFLVKNADFFALYSFHKTTKFWLLLFASFIVIGCLSMINAINVSESLVQLARLVSVFIALFCLLMFIRKNPISFFHFLCKVVIFSVVYFSWKAISHFIGNYNSPRTHEFLKLFPHNSGNINIYAAYVIVQFPFVIFSFIYFKKFWKYVAGLIVFMATLALFFVAARTALLSFLIIILLTVSYLIYTAIKHKSAVRFEIVYLVLIPIISLFIVLNTNKLDHNSMNTVGELFVSQNEDYYKGKKAALRNAVAIDTLLPKNIKIETDKNVSSGRFSIWKLAFSQFKEHPILGIGYGNFKASGKKEHYAVYAHRQGLYANPRRVHNDFLEKLAETGLFGFLAYIALFIVPFVLWIQLFRKEENLQQRFVYLSILSCAVAYTLDALLNFPLERPPIQLYFVFVVVCILSFYQQHISPKKATSYAKQKYVILGVVFLFGFAAIASNYAVFSSYKLQRTMRDDLQGKSLFSDQKLKNSYVSIQKQWAAYPQLTYVGTVKNVFLANYAIKAKKYDEAMAILNRSQQYNEDAFLVKVAKAELFLNAYDNVDSATYYSEAIFRDYPALKSNYTLLKNIYKKEKDSAGLFRVMHNYSKMNPLDVDEWETKANIIYNYTKDSKLMLKTLDTALAYNPTSNTLLEAKKKVLTKLNFKSFLSDAEVKAKHQAAYDYFAKHQYENARKVYQEILKTNPKDYLSIQNIGIIDLILKNYEKAIKNLTVVISANAFSDGKAEYSRGYCYEQLGNMEKAKADYRKSRAKNYPQALQLPAIKYQ